MERSREIDENRRYVIALPLLGVEISGCIEGCVECVVVRMGQRNGTESLADNGMACGEESHILQDAGGAPGLPHLRLSLDRHRGNILMDWGKV